MGGAVVGGRSFHRGSPDATGGWELASLSRSFLIPGAESFDSSPETGAEVLLVEGEEGIAGDEGTGVGPAVGAVGESGTDGILQKVGGGGEQGVLVALLFPKHMIMGLPLPLLGEEEILGITAQEGSGAELIGILRYPEPEDMDMVGHEDISGDDQPVAKGGVQEDLPERAGSSLVQPSGESSSDDMSPENSSPSPVPFPGNAGKLRAGRHEAGDSGRPEECR